MVRKERTGWRDLGLSDRHRKWGTNCPAVDLDFLMIEFDCGKAVALVEYKNEHAPIWSAAHPTVQAVIDLGSRAGVPVFVVRYASDYAWWTVTPLNRKAKDLVPEKLTKIPEREWVSLLYMMRGYVIPEEVLDAIEVEV